MRENKVKEFLNERFGEVRVITIKDELWFVAKDICDILGTKTKDLKTVLKGKGIDTIDILTNGGIQPMLVVNEASLYRQIFKSRKSFAEEFQDWICEEVIPTLRKDGIYVNGEEDVESVEELNQIVDEAMERKVLRKFGIGVRKDWSKTIEENWNIKTKYQYATYTNELVYKPIFNKTAKQLRDEFKVQKLRENLFTLEELSNIAKLENEICTLIEFGADYYGVKDYVNKKYKAS